MRGWLWLSRVVLISPTSWFWGAFPHLMLRLRPHTTPMCYLQGNFVKVLSSPAPSSPPQRPSWVGRSALGNEIAKRIMEDYAQGEQRNDI